MSDDEIVTIRDVPALLKVGEETIYMMAQVGDLPRLKVRGQWHFRCSDIDAWIADQVDHAKARPEDGGGDE